MDRQLIDYLPEILKEIKDFKEITSAEQPQISDLWDALYSLFNEKYLESETETGASKWENILELKPKSTDSLEVRNFRIHAKLVEDLPYTEKTFNRFLSTLCGENGYKYTMDYDNFHLSIQVSLFNKKLRDEVMALADRVIPANILIDVDILYNTHGLIKSKGFTYKALTKKSHAQMKEEELEG